MNRQKTTTEMQDAKERERKFREEIQQLTNEQLGQVLEYMIMLIKGQENGAEQTYQ